MKTITYTDPLAAAWMAKAHGVRFELSCGLSELLSDVANVDHDKSVYRVHPDSFALFEPRVGDVVLGLDGEPYLIETSESADAARTLSAIIIRRDCMAWIGGEVA